MEVSNVYVVYAFDEEGYERMIELFANESSALKSIFNEVSELSDKIIVEVGKGMYRMLNVEHYKNCLIDGIDVFDMNWFWQFEVSIHDVKS